VLIPDVLDGSLNEGPGEMVISNVQFNRIGDASSDETLDSILNMCEDFPKRSLAIDAILHHLLGREPLRIELQTVTRGFCMMIRLSFAVMGRSWWPRLVLRVLCQVKLRSQRDRLESIISSSRIR
jgi:hypothetical protein